MARQVGIEEDEGEELPPVRTREEAVELILKTVPQEFLDQCPGGLEQIREGLLRRVSELVQPGARKAFRDRFKAEQAAKVEERRRAWNQQHKKSKVLADSGPEGEGDAGAVFHSYPPEPAGLAKEGGGSVVRNADKTRSFIGPRLARIQGAIGGQRGKAPGAG